VTHRTLCAAAAAAPFAFAFLSAAGAAQAQASPNPWSGWYVGGLVGGAWGNTKVHSTVSTGNGVVVISPTDAAALAKVTSNDETKTGFTGGVEGGYNYLMGPWLFGIEADWTSLDLKNSNAKTLQSPLLLSPPVTYSLDQQLTTNWMVSLRPRVGYTAGPWMVFGTVGPAWSELKYRANFSDTRDPGDALSASTSSTKTGWAAGLGAGYALSNNLSLKGEWLHSDFGHVGTAETNSFVSITPDDSVRANMFRVGLDYRF
jgi:outer membrane immunogenic protein